MATENLALFQGLGAKMEFLNKRQNVISQNIANSDTPSYRARDLKEVSFESVVKAVDKTNRSTGKVQQAATRPGHITPGIDVNGDPKAKDQRHTYEVAPVGNTVIMEEQMIMSQKTTMDYNLMTNLYRKNVGLLTTALGRSQ